MLLVPWQGNNGGDGLVAARHLHHFGYDITVVYPKRSKGALFEGLVTQCRQLGIPVLGELSVPVGSFSVVMDAIFGFSFHGSPRPPFGGMLTAIKSSGVPVVSVDVPSGWDVDLGDVGGDGLSPDVLVSLTAPKKCAAAFKGRHFLGGRFVPPRLRERYGLEGLPKYEGVAQVVELEGWGGQTGEASPFEGTGGGNSEEQLAVVWVTAPADEAPKLAAALVEAKVAACVNIVPGVESVYKWDGEMETTRESMLMVKTRASLLPRLTAIVGKEHSYDVPETLAAAVVGGNRLYMDWVREMTK